MKGLSLWMCMIVIGVMSVLCTLSVSTRMMRDAKLSAAVKDCARLTVADTMHCDSVVIRDEYEMSAYFMAHLFGVLEGESDLEVNVAKADAQWGMFEVTVSEHYSDPMNSQGTQTLSYSVTAVCDKEQPEDIDQRIRMLRTSYTESSGASGDLSGDVALGKNPDEEIRLVDKTYMRKSYASGGLKENSVWRVRYDEEKGAQVWRFDAKEKNEIAEAFAKVQTQAGDPEKYQVAIDALIQSITAGEYSSCREQ